MLASKLTRGTSDTPTQQIFRQQRFYLLRYPIFLDTMLTVTLYLG